ncbi:MAG: YqaE/Pmp3 family membrane protein [Proteobacteria bacterium]|nr:YqaE/Pmp3 family membrane protein [Pseudomonadota bacterium]
MGLFRVIIAIVFPPLAVIDKGCGPLLLTFLLTLIGWVPGVIAAILFCTQDD